MKAMRIGKTAPSRAGKRQILVYLDPDVVAAAHAKARSDGKSVQELMAEAINAVYALHGLEPPIRPEHCRLVRRAAGAKIKTEDHGVAKCRNGKQTLGGWFDKADKEAVKAFADRVGLGLQGMLDMGVRQITGLRDYDTRTVEERAEAGGGAMAA